MKAIHWLLLDNLMNNYPCKSNLSNSQFEEAMDWVKMNGFIDKTTLGITGEGKGYFLLHQHDKLQRDVLSDNE